MTDSTPAEPSTTPAPSDETPGGATAESTAQETAAAETAAETAAVETAVPTTAGLTAAGENIAEQTVVKGRRVLLVAGAVAVVVLLALAAVAVFVLGREERGEVGECVRDSVVVDCAEPHEARIVQIVTDVNGCEPPATHPMKEADNRYLCLVEEPS